MRGIKKLIFVGLIGIGGLLLTLAGLNLISLSETLILYAGILLLVVSTLLYFFL
ncbi:hypothetical protein HY404_02750 [Candidatus Microgenomates bacterium]|nr:hypothetical protein [Candidatus Microgenomates bacterium]